MKIEQLLVQHFYAQREVTLQGMGTFRLSPDFVIPQENDKDTVIPENAVSFQYNSRATEDDALINYIVQQTHKIKPLASADLDSYLTLGKQFLNIGKPFPIPGLGHLEKNQLGEYQFLQGDIVNTKAEVAATVRDKPEENDISFASERKASPVNKKAIWIVVAVVGLGMIGAAAWYFLNRKGDDAAKIVVVDSPTTVPVPVDTTKIINDTAKISLPKTDTLTSSDGYTFKVVFKVTSNMAAAIEKMKVLTTRGHKVIMYTSDSITYKLAEPFNRPLSDTTRVRDSLNNFYYLGKAYIELK